MFQFRQVLVRLRAGDTAGELARSGLLGRDKLTELLRVAQAHGWLDAGTELPDDQAIVAAMGPRKRAVSTVSSAEPLREIVQRWFDAGVQGSAIHAALVREYAFTGSYSAVRRMLQGMRGSQPPEATVRLRFAPAQAAQVAYTEFLAMLIGDEVARRENKKFSMRLRRAQFRTTKTLEQFDFERLPKLNRALVHDLATGRYLHEKAPVLIVGPSGTGKSHLAQALGHCAVRQGVDVVFSTCTALSLLSMA